MKIFLSVLLLISIAGNVYLFLNPKEKVIVKQEMPKEEIEKIREISQVCGIDNRSFDNASVLSNLSDIKSTLWSNTRTCNSTPISPEEMDIIGVYLSNRQDLLSKINSQNSFITSCSMKRVVILPANE